MELCGKDYVLRRLSARGTWHYDFGLSLLQELSWGGFVSVRRGAQIKCLRDQRESDKVYCWLPKLCI